MAAAKKTVEAELVGDNTVKVFRGDEYSEWSKANGLIDGRHPDQVIRFSLEALGVYISEGKSRQWVMNKYGISPEDLQAMLINLSNLERRDKVITWR